VQRLGSVGERPLGVSVLDDLQVTMSRARYLVGYGAGTGYDSSTGRPGRLPLPTHWAALIGWLRPGKTQRWRSGRNVCRRPAQAARRRIEAEQLLQSSASTDRTVSPTRTMSPDDTSAAATSPGSPPPASTCLMRFSTSASPGSSHR
jgi:hypothetical protein